MKFALIADLHFGSIPDGLADALAEELLGHAPDLIVVAGDLTLRARAHEFAAARAWLWKLTPPVLVLPGNHDLPYFNLYQRFSNPFGRFEQAMEGLMMPVFRHEGGLVLGFNTTRSWQPHLRWQEGVARRRDIEAACRALAAAPAGAFKVIAAHHPFLKGAGSPRARPVLRAVEGLDAFVQGGAAMILSGHTHQSFAVETEHAGRPLIAVGAPTALSSRTRGEANGYWLITVGRDRVIASLFLRSGTHFRQAAERTFPRLDSIFPSKWNCTG
jgi:3',5'-cyclic AMP phosphodiesterase CpdA